MKFIPLVLAIVIGAVVMALMKSLLGIHRPKGLTRRDFVDVAYMAWGGVIAIAAFSSFE